MDREAWSVSAEVEESRSRDHEEECPPPDHCSCMERGSCLLRDDSLVTDEELLAGKERTGFVDFDSFVVAAALSDHQLGWWGWRRCQDKVCEAGSWTSRCQVSGPHLND